jgi:hypothetical protein
LDIQHVNVKLIVQNSEYTDLEPVIPVFHRWIQDQACEELLLDVADYRHVPAGPGVVLIGHEANYSVDNADNRLGVRYNRKALLDGNLEDRLEQAVRAAIGACQRLEDDPHLNGKIRFNRHEMEMFINDRLLAANSTRTREALEPEIRALCQRLFRGAEYSLGHEQSDPRKLFSVSISTEEAFTPNELLENLLA